MRQILQLIDAHLRGVDVELCRVDLGVDRGVALLQPGQVGLAAFDLRRNVLQASGHLDKLLGRPLVVGVVLEDFAKTLRLLQERRALVGKLLQLGLPGG